MSQIDLRQYFSPEAVVQRLMALPPLKSTVVDEFFKRKVNHPFAKVGRSDLTDLALPAPLIMRGAPSVLMAGGPLSLDDFEPFEAAIHDFMTAADLNNFRLLDKSGIEAVLAGKDDKLRRVCRVTTEGIASTALTGVVSWPVRLEGGGYDTYQVNFGATLSTTPTALWDAVDTPLLQVYNDLQEIETAIQEEGYGGKVRFWAGKKAYLQILGLVETYSANKNARLKVDMGEGFVIVGGYKVEKMVERYRNPQSGAMTAKVADHKIMGWAEDAVHTLFYCALDDLDAKLQPLPYFSKPIKTEDPSGVKILGRSKPFPAVAPKGVCWSTVCAP